MKSFVEGCSKRELEIYLRFHQIYGTKAASLDRFTLSGATESYKTGYYGRINCQEPWITYVNSDELFRPGRLMLFYYEVEEKDAGCEVTGKWRFPSWYRKSSVGFFILPFFIELVMGFSLEGLALFYLAVIIGYGLYYAMSRLSAPEDKITELFNNVKNIN